jgi:hypothetical protein
LLAEGDKNDFFCNNFERGVDLSLVCDTRMRYLIDRKFKAHVLHSWDGSKFRYLGFVTHTLSVVAMTKDESKFQ